MEETPINTKAPHAPVTEQSQEQHQSLIVTEKQIEILARRLLPEIKRFFANEDRQKEFEEWKQNRRSESIDKV